MADVDIAIRSVTGAYSGSTTSVTTPAGTAVGDFLLVIANVDYLAAAANPRILPADGVGAWSEVAAAADPASGNTIMSIRAWLGRVEQAGARTVSVAQDGTSGLQVLAYVLNAAGGVVARDGAPVAIVDRVRPYGFPSGLVPGGTRATQFIAHGGIQFSGALSYTPPNDMAGVQQQQPAGYSALQAAYVRHNSTAATPARNSTSNVANLSGGAGLSFLLRAQTVDAPAGPEPGRGMLAC